MWTLKTHKKDNTKMAVLDTLKKNPLRIYRNSNILDTHAHNFLV
jgi:hypothetical protein